MSTDKRLRAFLAVPAALQKGSQIPHFLVEHSPAKRVEDVSSLEGSNPSLSANHNTLAKV